MEKSEIISLITLSCALVALVIMITGLVITMGMNTNIENSFSGIFTWIFIIVNEL